MIKINDKNQIVIYPVTPVYVNDEISHFITTVRMKEIGEVFPRLSYDGEAQRGYLEKNEVKSPMIDKSHMNNIKNTILNGDNIHGTLIWNIRKFEDIDDLEVEYYEYNQNKNELIIRGNTITLPDSAHRHFAISSIYKQDKDDEVLENEMVLQIYSMNFEEEKDFFRTSNNGKPIVRNRKLYLSNDIKCLLLRDVITNSLLKNRVEFAKNHANTKNKLIKFSTLYDSLFDNSMVYNNYTINESNYEVLKNWLIKFYNELLSTREEFNFVNKKEKLELKQETMLIEEISWWGYAILAKKIQNDTNWKRTLNNKMNKTFGLTSGLSVDFWSKSNTDWWGTVLQYAIDTVTKEVIITPRVTNSATTRKKMRDTVAIRLFS